MHCETKPSRRFLLSMMLAVLFLVTPQRAVPAAMAEAEGLTTSDIIERMQRVYAESQSYSDSGLVEIVFIRPDGRRTLKIPFATAFVRPDRFRFEFTEEQYGVRNFRFIVHRDGEEVQIYWDYEKGVRRLESLDRALASAAGVSQGSAQTVPAMLLPLEVTWRRAIRFNDPKRIDDDIVENRECFRIVDRILGNPTTLWIDKETFLLRKIYREQEFDDFRGQATTTYKPVLNGTVTEGMLEFDAPRRGAW